MALGFYFAPASMSAAQYDTCIAELKKAGAHHPPGRTHHAAFGPSDKIAVFDIWTSQKAFDKFGTVLMPILAKIGVDPGQPMVMPIRRIIVPPAKAAKSAPKAAKKKAKTPAARRRRRK